jgi:hypothetical protein
VEKAAVFLRPCDYIHHPSQEGEAADSTKQWGPEVRILDKGQFSELSPSSAYHNTLGSIFNKATII